MAQDVLIDDVSAGYTFGEQIQIKASVQAASPVTEAYLFVKTERDAVESYRLAVNPSGDIAYTYDLRQKPIPPFTKVYYWFRIASAGGDYTSPSYWFDYTDNRFAWQAQTGPIFRVYWYQGDLTFGQMATNIAYEGLASAQKLFPVSPRLPLDIYIYASAADFQSSLQLGGMSWVGGVASPEAGKVMVSQEDGPDQKVALERQIPHELTHVLLYQLTGAGYAKLPTWLVEGLASLAELYPNPDYQRALDSARASRQLLPIESLCGAFPNDSTRAYLAYAESASFTRYIHQQYGNDGIQNLLIQYQNGLGCAEGVQAALGVPLASLALNWQDETFGSRAGLAALQNTAPYLFLLVVVLAVPLAAGIYRKNRKPVKLPIENK